NLDGRAIVAARGERVLAVAIDPKPATPFDAELVLRQRGRIRSQEVESDLSFDADNGRLIPPVRVAVERRRHPALWPHPQDWHEDDQHEGNTCHALHVALERAAFRPRQAIRCCMCAAAFMSTRRSSRCSRAADRFLSGAAIEALACAA